MGNSAPGGVAHRERRRGPVAPILIDVLDVLAGSALSESVHQPVRGPIGLWTLLRLASATMAGLLLHVGKQGRCDDGAAEISQDVDDVCAERHGQVPGQAQRGGLLLAPVHGFQVPLPLLSDYRISLTWRPKRPTPGNHRVKSISGASGSGCPSWFVEAWVVVALNGVKDAVLGPVAGVWLAFVGELLWIDFHFDNVLCFDLDTWGWGLRMGLGVRIGGAHPVIGAGARGYG